MSGRNPRDAVKNFLGPLQRAFACVSQDVLCVSPRGYEPVDNGEPHLVTPNLTETRLRREAGNDLVLVMRHHYRIVEAQGELGPWKTTTAGYDYALQDDEDTEIVSFHWHPEARGNYPNPHVHIGTAHLAGITLGRKQHLPTGRISLEEVVRFAIDELGASVRAGSEATWATVLAETEALHKEHRSWG